MSASADAGEVRVRLRPADEGDWPMIRRWLAEPDIVRWWGPKATTEAEVMLAMGTSQAISRIIEATDGSQQDRWAPVGYGHALDAMLLGDPLPADLPVGAWELDLFVASPAHRGRGVGLRALEQLRDELFETTLACAGCVRVGVGNETAVRAYEKAGFRWRAVVRDPVMGPEWVMVRDR
jgi:RimJ/RimL family protein N-acetyltransferase